jgi:hypothetical protein
MLLGIFEFVLVDPSFTASFRGMLAAPLPSAFVFVPAPQEILGYFLFASL